MRGARGWFNPRQAVGDIGIGLCSGALGVAFLVGSLELGLGNVRLPGSGMFPSLVATLLIAVSCLRLWTDFQVLGGRDLGRVTLGHRASAIVAVVMIVGSLIFEAVGFIATTFLMMFLLAKTVGGSRLLSALLFASITTIGAYSVFHFFFEVNLPYGSLYGG